MRYTFNFPDLGEGLEEGTILEWYVKEGDSVKVGDAVVQMETDKVVADIPSPKSGTITARYGNVGDVIHVGAPLVEIEQVSSGSEQADPEEKPATQPISEPEEGAAVVGTMELAGENALLAASDEGSSETGSTRDEARKVLATPVARALAKELGIDIRDVPGSDP